MNHLKYTGEALLNQAIHIPASQKKAPETIFPYLPEAQLVQAVNLAILLKRPLLLMGEPGGGKSKLAQALAFELFHRQQANEDGEIEIEQHYRDWFFTWHVKSTSAAKDGLYEFDAVRRLRDAQIQKDDLDIAQYIEYGPMGKAFENSTSESKRPVLLIDEIDKADLDFPNDLLNELDLGAFFIKETRKDVVAQIKPIVIITSNQERELPDAFLRRCIYHYIKPLQEKDLRRIILSRFYPEGERIENKLKEEAEDNFINDVLGVFLRIRTEIGKKQNGRARMSLPASCWIGLRR